MVSATIPTCDNCFLFPKFVNCRVKKRKMELFEDVTSPESSSFPGEPAQGLGGAFMIT